MAHVISDFRVPGVQDSRSQNTVLSGSRTPRHRIVETSLHTISRFATFGGSHVKSLNSCQRECRNPDSRNADNILPRLRILGFSLPCVPITRPQDLRNPELRSSEILTSSLFLYTRNSFRVSGIWSTKGFGSHSGLTNSESPK
jgi:hypothetical protein